MARQRKLSPERKAFINSLLEHYNPKDAGDVQEMLKDLLGDTLQGMLEAEMDEKLGYSKYDYQHKQTDDSRNGYSKKTVTSSMGDIELDIPRDRKGEFEPQIVKKNQTDISNIEDQVLSMYGADAVDSLPKHYREALMLYADIADSPEIQIADSVMHEKLGKLRELEAMYDDAFIRGNYVRRSFGRTYWWYFLYSN